MTAGEKLERNEAIDMLRGLSMFVMVLLHTNAYFLSNSFVYFVWNYSQFAVPVFIFCSSYLFFVKKYPLNKRKEIVVHIKKRLSRLLAPYYLFAIVYIFLQYTKEPSKVSFQYLFQNLTITEGISINWLVLLFVFFIFLMPLILYLWNHKRIFFSVYVFFSVTSSVIFMFLQPPFNYRFIMWLPWSLIIIFSFFLAKNDHKDRLFFSFFLLWLTIFAVTYFIERGVGHSLRMFDNKYTPNLYHLSYGLASIPALYFLAKKRLFSFPILRQLFHFLSINSYPFYFLHWIVLYVVTVFFRIRFNWVSFFLTVLLTTTIVQMILNRSFHWIKNYRFSTL